MKILENILSKFGIEKVSEMHQPQDGYTPLTQVKFLRQVITAASDGAIAAMAAERQLGIRD